MFVDVSKNPNHQGDQTTLVSCTSCILYASKKLPRDLEESNLAVVDLIGYQVTTQVCLRNWFIPMEWISRYFLFVFSVFFGSSTSFANNSIELSVFFSIASINAFLNILVRDGQIFDFTSFKSPWKGILKAN